MGSKSKPKGDAAGVRDDINSFLDSLTEGGDENTGDLERFAARVGARPVKLINAARTGDSEPETLEVLVRPISYAAELCVASSIPRPTAPMVTDKDGNRQPDYDDEAYVDRSVTRNIAYEAGIAAIAIDLKLEDGRTYRSPGRCAGGNNEARKLFVRDAARHMINNHTADEIARILKAFGEISDPAALVNDAGKPSAPTSATSSKTQESGASQSRPSGPPTSQTSAPSDRV